MEEGAAERTAAQVAMAESVAAAENIHELEQAAAEAAAEEVNVAGRSVAGAWAQGVAAEVEAPEPPEVGQCGSVLHDYCKDAIFISGSSLRIRTA